MEPAPTVLSGIRDLLASERGVFAIALAIAAAVMVGVGKMTTDQWINFNEWLGGILIASKTVTTAVEIAKRPASPTAPAVPANASPAPVTGSVAAGGFAIAAGGVATAGVTPSTPVK